MFQPRAVTLICIVLFAAAVRVLPHPDNFTPIAALALFAGAHFARSWAAAVVALAAWQISNFALGHSFHAVHLFVCGSIVAAVLIGRSLLRRQSIMRVAAATIAGSLVFFVLTNFGFWLTGGVYPTTFDGLLTCYWKAIPFYRMTLVGDLFYAAILFGGFAFATRVVPRLQESSGAIVAQEKVGYN